MGRIILTIGLAMMLAAVAPTLASAQPGLKNNPGPVTLYSAHPAEPLLCEYEACGSHSALYYATKGSIELWEWTPSTGEVCTGPYGNGKTHGETQWACYGHNEIWRWQVNVDPWGAMTYGDEYEFY